MSLSRRAIRILPSLPVARLTPFHQALRRLLERLPGRLQTEMGGRLPSNQWSPSRRNRWPLLPGKRSEHAIGFAQTIQKDLVEAIPDSGGSRARLTKSEGGLSDGDLSDALGSDRGFGRLS
jgi:molybdopterin biosynthesis enzyme